MKNELAASIGLAILGIIVSYFVCNLFVGQIEEISFPSITSSTDTTLQSPNPEVFNYKALNPTVEVYVGNCNSYDSNGECLDEGSK